MRFIMLTVLIDMLAIGLIVPVLPALVGSSPPTRRNRPVVRRGRVGLRRWPTSSPRRCWARCPTATAAGRCCCWASAAWPELLRHRAGHGAVDAGGGRAGRRGHAGQCGGGQCLRGRHHRRRDRARASACWARCSASGFILGPVMGGLLGAIDLHLPFFVAGTLALLNLAYGYFVLPESLPPDRASRSTGARQPAAALRRAGALKGVGPLVAWWPVGAGAVHAVHRAGCCTPPSSSAGARQENGWSLFAVGHHVGPGAGRSCWAGCSSASARSALAMVGLVSSHPGLRGLWGLATQGWMMYAVIVCQPAGRRHGVGRDAEPGVQRGRRRSQGQTMGAVASLGSLMAVLAPVIAAPLLGGCRTCPQGDWRIGAPMYFCAAAAGCCRCCWPSALPAPGAAPPPAPAAS
jgi:DHA1 family tetracycline resistance protein-like MFS transporter